MNSVLCGLTVASRRISFKLWADYNHHPTYRAFITFVHYGMGFAIITVFFPVAVDGTTHAAIYIPTAQFPKHIVLPMC